MIRDSHFRPRWYLKNPHMQTLFASIWRKKPDHVWQRERVELPDGDFIDLDWGKRMADAPLVMILHGLEGSGRSNYALGLGQALEKLGWNAVVMNFRGCSGELNRKPYSYCAGCTDDIEWMTQRLRQQHPGQPFYLVGYSLGGNAMLKWLGESGTRDVDGAVAVSVPYRLGECAKRLQSGFSRLYEKHLLRSLKASVSARLGEMDLGITQKQIRGLHSFYDFDDQVTAPLHGYNGVEDYYGRASAWQWVHRIQVPTLLIHALDDPFMYPATVPSPQDLNDHVTLELSDHGGHVGFIANDPKQPYWLEQRIPEWFVSISQT
ncbi:unnamed protein product [Cyprideis torosa]|uniref:Uncharacterized protein n=1 Tax=Cyprideis torosa TaxID=163714 RepID=A0A7R8WQQ6_9CRUS|nr:unnamed protein product [Cyprideis torosa]CAG0908157.1 unnamed protein product [Cyprideis torosa]